MASAPLLGSYKLSLMANRPSTHTAATHPFLLVLSYPTPTRPTRTISTRIPFEASYHDLQSPWVATADLSRSNPPSLHSGQAIRLPPKGQLTLIIQNEFSTPLRLLLFPYNLRRLPANSTVLLRRMWYVGQALKYAVHLQFASFPHSQNDSNHRDAENLFDDDGTAEQTNARRKANPIFLFREIRLVFASSSPDQDEELRVESEGDDNIFPWTHWPARLPRRPSATPRSTHTGRASSLSAMSLPETDSVLHSTQTSP